ncbi:hypothetical protein VTJ49DRAFT_1536 [Mycothermus thermophilus]|uniref:Uncharacterized protein n=1 Tax=Humicola insolens TaxID=85995 RepID=A0ABR3VC74_HUMIN
MSASSDQVAAAARLILSDVGRRITAHWYCCGGSSSNNTNPRSPSATAIVLLRAAANAIHVGFGLYYRHFEGNWTQVLWPVVDQLVVAWAVSFVVEEEGERTVFGVKLTENFFDGFLYFWAFLHGLHLVLLAALVLSYAYFFGQTGWFFLTALGLAILPVAWVAARPGVDGDGGLVLP